MLLLELKLQEFLAKQRILKRVGLIRRKKITIYWKWNNTILWVDIIPLSVFGVRFLKEEKKLDYQIMDINIYICNVLIIGD